MIVKGTQGFASMDKTKLRAICAKGGRAAQKKGKCHHWTAVEAKAAGRRGGIASHGGRGRTPVIH